jgi:hypothetical protein
MCCGIVTKDELIWKKDGSAGVVLDKLSLQKIKVYTISSAS